MDIPQLYHRFILWIGDGTGLPDSILHIHAGMAILLVVRVLTGRSLATFIPFLAVLVLQTANEVMDYLAYGLRLEDTISDFANTLFWPFVLSLGVRLRPMRLRDHPGWMLPESTFSDRPSELPPLQAGKRIRPARELTH